MNQGMWITDAQRTIHKLRFQVTVFHTLKQPKDRPPSMGDQRGTAKVVINVDTNARKAAIDPKDL